MFCYNSNGLLENKDLGNPYVFRNNEYRQLPITYNHILGFSENKISEIPLSSSKTKGWNPYLYSVVTTSGAVDLTTFVREGINNVVGLFLCECSGSLYTFNGIQCRNIFKTLIQMPHTINIEINSGDSVFMVLTLIS